MADALEVLKFSVRDFWDDFVLLVLMNMVWGVALLLPAVPLLILDDIPLLWALALSLLLLLPLPIVSAALCFATNQVARGTAANWGDFVAGLRRYWAKGLAVAAINLSALLLLVVNLRFYAVALQGDWTLVVLVIWGALGLYWLLVQVFWFPMILELESEKVLVGLRSALVMALVTPGFSLSLGAILVVLAVLSVLLSLPVVLFTASLFLLIANHATRSRLAFARGEQYRPGLDSG